MPLETAGVKDYVNVVSGTLITSGDERGHHSGTVGILSGAPMVVAAANGAPYRSTFSKPSIDQVAAGIIGTPSRYKSLEVGISPRVNANEGTTLRYLSHNGPTARTRPSTTRQALRPDLRHGLHAARRDGTPVVDATLATARASSTSCSRISPSVRGRAGAADRVRLDRHAEGIRSIENRLMVSAMPVTPAASCKLPVKPSSPSPTWAARSRSSPRRRR
jgi:hypothetical protein